MIHVVIVGAYGSAGAAVAKSLAEEPDVQLTLIDDGDPGGGLCILRGCMPSKEVLSAGAHRFQARHDDRLLGDPHEVDLDRTIERKDDHTLGWAEHRRESIHEITERSDVEFVHDTARFVDDHTVVAGGREITGDYVVIATGSAINVPDLPGIEDVPHQTSADLLDATELPDSAVVMGLGYVGLEMVPYLSEVGGTDVTVVEHDERPIDEADPSFGDTILDLYREQFDVTIPTECYERRVEPTDDGGVRLYLEHVDGDDEVVEADELYLFTGRRPCVGRLGLKNSALERGPDWVLDTMQARDDDQVFVVGDVNGKEPILHVAKEQGFTAAENILRRERGEPLTAYENVTHHVIFSGLGVYPYARVGMTEREARDAGYDIAVAKRQASDDGVFEAKDTPEGVAKLVVDRESATVLGWQGLHYHADVMAKTMQVVVEMGLDVREVPDRAYHPTTPEILDGLLRDATDELAE
ncbi:pyridine nucleotide-disulfide oxidoreductase dimerization region [Halosimplex carlsbadense 2-9-1]|uniref:Pyridine nucleotide-disulfide oxidoreductase dimerization region n=1 Tax=Halosimplex carlsbadense 2-9-1 TaxID=797114 RepID=M0CJD8_9EURY|nr:NAD(P)/FAD-dependent oxidoreductase [Halosimplex carlsbadense]ELZ22748.1 pyridine nucleotide-disulfide oxidoreductase dimerization region [Halosimplex carlsbadense 2-9-1]